MTNLGDKRVLVVDDEEDVREFLATVLEDAGFVVVTAADGDEALELVRQQPPDFISLDLVMPRKSGVRFLYELRRKRAWAKIPVMIVTAHAHDDLGRDDFRDMFEGKGLLSPGGHLEKPVDPDIYVRRVCEGMGLAYQPEPEANGVGQMRSEAEQLLSRADPDKLAEILALLRREQS